MRTTDRFDRWLRRLRRLGGSTGWVTAPLVGLALASTAVVLAAGLVQVTFGSYSMTVEEAWRAVLDPAVVLEPSTLAAFVLGGEIPDTVSTETLVVWNLRLPRVVVAALVGANLAISGAIFQGVTRNELASPFILGVSGGAGLAVLVVFVLLPQLSAYVPVFAALGGAAAFLTVYAIAWQGGTNPVRLILAGVIVGTMCQSLQRALFFFADDIGVVQSALAWTTGSLTGVDWEQVRMVLPATVLVVLAAVIAARQLNVLILGESTANSLGMEVERTRFAVSALAIVAASASVAVAGIVGFVGLIVPHAVRTVVGSDYRRLIAGCVFLGPALMVAADVGARLALDSGQMPVGVVTGLVGGPYFLYLMKTRTDLGSI